MSKTMSTDWKELSEAASRELDPQKLMELVEQLNKVLEEKEKQKRGNVTDLPPHNPSSPFMDSSRLQA